MYVYIYIYIVYRNICYLILMALFKMSNNYMYIHIYELLTNIILLHRHEYISGN